MIKADILIIGAGPTGLFTVFEAGLLKLRCHLIDSLPQAGGQCAEIYPKKPIYDIPGFPEVLAGDLVKNLMKQIEPFSPKFTLGERAETIEKFEKGYIVTTDKGTKHYAPIVAIAGGLGSFEPRKPVIKNISNYENKGVEYIIKNPELYINEKIVIAGGGDSALDWCIFLSEIAKKVTLIHRRKEFRAALDSVDKLQVLKNTGKIDVITPAEISLLYGKEHLSAIEIIKEGGESLYIETDHFIPLFGLSPKLGPISNWGLEIEKNAIRVNTFDYQTNLPGIYAIGDVNIYPGKLKLILCGFHEATLMCQSAYRIIFPNKKNIMKYTTVSGINGFDGSNKKAPKPTIKKIY